MGSFQENINEYKKHLENGLIKDAYKGLMEYIMGLKTYLKKNYPDYFVSDNIYFGYMDMTYFSFTPRTLKERNLKIAIVFIHETGSFEVWLAGINKRIQQKYWDVFRQSDWNKYPLVPTTKGVDSIMEYVLIGNPDFNDLGALTNQIEQKILEFIDAVESFLSKQ